MKGHEGVSPSSGNRLYRIDANSGPLTLFYEAEAELRPVFDNPLGITETPVAELPWDAWDYLYPSRYCPSDQLSRLAMQEFGDLSPGYSRITAICNWIYENISYVRGETTAHTSAFDTATMRIGVCRDFAHLAISFCRALNIPARYVSNYAYLLDPPDFHACFEAYLGGRWYLFDPTRLAPQTGFLRIGVGRDAADVSFATIIGDTTLDWMNIQVEVLAGSDFPDWTTQAISTA